MVFRGLVPLISGLVALHAEAMTESYCRPGEKISKPDFTLHVTTAERANGSLYEITARNAEKFPVYLEVTMTKLSNYKSERGNTFVFKVEAESEVIMNTLTPVNPQRPATFNYTYALYLSDLRTFNPNKKFAYQLPFETGFTSPILQGYKGKFSHFTEFNLHALDFGMPRGTRILAARAGVVVASRSDVQTGGLDPAISASVDGAGNFVMVLHDDGTFANYCHLQCGGTRLGKGDRVAIGEEIGYSGSTGYSHPDYPHLHFVVRIPERKNPYGNKTIPVLFKSGTQAIHLEEGKLYNR